MAAGETFREVLRRGVVIPASPLALTARRRLDERRQRALWRYYSAAGAGGIAVGVHTTQFEIREPQHGLLRPLLELAADEFSRLDGRRRTPLVRIAGICGPTRQAAAEAEQAASLGFHAGLVSLAALAGASDDELIGHLRTVARTVPLVGFYLQPAVGGRVLSYGFWRRFAEIPEAVAVKIAPFNRYHTIDVVRAVAESGRDDIALYTGNDDNIVADLVTPFRFRAGGRWAERRIVGGLLGQWSVWTKKAVDLLARCHRLAASGGAARGGGRAGGKCRGAGIGHRIGAGRTPVPADLLRLGAELTDANAAIFDAAHNFAGCIPGIHEVLRRQGLLAGTWCLDRRLGLSPGQGEEIGRVLAAYPHLTDDNFVTEHRDEWLKE